MSYENWKILKTELAEKQDEYTKVAEWCNESQQYYIDDDGTYYKVVKTPEPTEDEKKQQVRVVRSQYYETYVDWYQSKPLLWAELTEDEKTDIVNYRLYLKDYTDNENWWESNPLDFPSWKEQNNSDDVLSEVPENKGQSNESEVI